MKHKFNKNKSFIKIYKRKSELQKIMVNRKLNSLNKVNLFSLE